MNEKFIRVLVEGLRIGQTEKDTNMRHYDDAVKYFHSKMRMMQERVEAQHENNELLVKERVIYEERMQELAYENSLLQKRVDALAQDIIN